MSQQASKSPSHVLADVQARIGARIVLNPPATYTYEQWVNEGTRLFGPSQDEWRFQCPSCGHVASAKDWEKPFNLLLSFQCLIGFRGPVAASNEEEAPAATCDGPVDDLRPVTVILNDIHHTLFDFAR